MDVDYLRVALREDAQLVGAPDPDLYERVRARRQRSDRRRLAALAAGLAALLVGVAVPVSLTVLQRPDESGEVANPSGIEGFMGLPTRGNLSGDTDFLEQVRQLPWGGPDGELGNPAIASRHVVFAADVSGQRWVLVGGTVDGGYVSATWFFGPEGATPSQLVTGSEQGIVLPDHPVTAVRADNPGLALVVVTAPGDLVEISRHVEIDNVGSISRSYEPLDTVDGIAITGIEAISGGIGVSVQVTRDGRRLFRGEPTIQSGGVSDAVCPATCGFEAPPLESIDFEDPRGLAGVVPDPSWISRGFATLAAPIARPINELSPVLLFAGPIPGPPGWETTVIVVAVTLPSGATAVSSTIVESRIEQGGAILSVGGEIYVQPPGLVELAGLALLLEFRPGMASALTPMSLLILAPPQYTSARPLGPNDAPVGPDIPLSDGLAVIPYLDPTVHLELLRSGGESTTTIIGEGEVTTRYSDAGPGYSD